MLAVLLTHASIANLLLKNGAEANEQLVRCVVQDESVQDESQISCV